MDEKKNTFAPLWPYYKKVWNKAREIEGRHWLSRAGGEVMLIAIGAGVWGLVIGFGKVVEAEGIGFGIAGSALIAYGLWRLLTSLIRAPAEIDAEQCKKIAEFEKLSPLQLIFDESRHLTWSDDRKIAYASLEVKNNDPSNAFENVTVVINSIELLGDEIPLDTKFLEGRKLAVAWPLGTNDPRPHSSLKTETTIKAGNSAFFKFVNVQTSPHDHFLYHGECEKEISDQFSPSGDRSDYISYSQKPIGRIPAGFYRVTVTAQGNGTPAFTRTFRFWGTRTKPFFKPE